MADLADPMLDHREAIRWAIATAALDARNALERVRRAALVAGVCGVDEALIRDLLDDVVLAANVAAGELRRVALRTDYDAASMLGAA